MSMHFGSMVVASLVAAVLGLGCGEASPAMGGGGTAASGGGGDGGAGGAEPVAVWPLSGVDFDAPSDDLLPFAALVAEASVIGIGESVHTTGGELRMRARLIRYLVEAEGIRVIVLENEWEETERTVAPHVDACSGTAEEAAMGLNPVWWDVSTPRLLAWLCAYNQTHADDPVRVLGMDIRQAWYDHPAVVSYLEAVAPADAPSVADGTSTCLGVGHASREDFFADPLVQAYFSGGAPLPEADHQACLAGVDAAIALFASRRDELIAKSDERAFERARLRLVGMRAFDTSIYHLSRGDLELANPPRDAAMADVLLTFQRLEFPDRRAVVFAHDGHVLRRSDEVLAGQWRGVKNVGTLVAEALGDAYHAVGQVSLTTEIDWFGGPQTLDNDQPGHLEPRLADLGHDFALVDTDAATTMGLWMAGTGYEVGFDTLIPAQHYDALVFHRRSPAADYFTPPPF